MKNNILNLFGILCLFITACSDKPTLEELQLFAATETFPKDTYLDTVSNKKALVIVAHDDDDCAMAGTIAKLNSAGWIIKQLSLESHPMTNGNGENPSGIICTGNIVILNDKHYREGMDSNSSPYIPIPYADIKQQYLTDKVADALIPLINDFNPSVIFTLDNVKGGYGHPDHIFISQLVLDLLKDGKIGTPRIYQSVYTDHMEHQIVDIWLKERMKKWGYPHASDIANEMYDIDGMPEPTVQISIVEQAETKMKYLRAYPESVRKNLRKFVPYYEEFDAVTYFSIFDKEYFRVIEN